VHDRESGGDDRGTGLELSDEDLRELHEIGR